MQVTYLPREMLEEELELQSLAPLPGLNAPPPPIHRTASRDGLHRAPLAIHTAQLRPAQTGRAINAPHLHLCGYVVTRIGREHQRRGQACEDVAHWQSPLLASRPAATLLAELHSNVTHLSGGGVSAMEHTAGAGAPAVLLGSDVIGGTADWGSALAEALAEIEELRSTEASLQPGSGQRCSLRTETLAAPPDRPVPVAAGIFCVFDGHCGREAAEQAQKLVPDHVAGCLDTHQRLLQQVHSRPFS